MKLTLHKSFAVLLLLCTFAVALVLCTSATYGDYGYLRYYSSYGKVTITDCEESATAVTIPSEIDGYPVTSIGGSAFRDCSSLKSITIPSGVTGIWDSAFEYCSSLTSITIPDSVTSIGGYAFWGCSGLTSITIPDSVTSVGIEAFKSTAWYNNQPDGLVYAGKVAYKYKGTMPSGTSIVLREGTTDIEDSAFWGCSGLTSITIPSGVTSIGGSAFRDCSSLKSITIPDSVTSIRSRAFSGCSSLTSIIIPSGVTSIGYSAFSDCRNLTSITILNPQCSIYDDSDTISESATIYGYELSRSQQLYGYYSTAWLYANKYNRTFVKLGGHTHTYAADYTVDTPATCVNAGSKSRHCTLCGAKMDETVIPATGHKYGDWKVRTPAKCEETGVDYHVCSVCKNEETRASAKLGHSYSTAWTIDTAATCTEVGSKSHHCTRCDAKSDVTVIPATGHKYGDWKVRTPAKCEETGVDYHVCSVCKNEETRASAKLGHSYSTAWTIDTAATCTEVGSKSHHCTRCDAKADITEISAGHKYGDWKVRTPAKCEEAGVDYHVCSVCANEETRASAKLGHDYATVWTTDTAATCTEVGSKSHHCTVCDARTDITVIPATGVHTDADGDGKCDDCGKLFGMNWELDETTGELTVTGDGAVTDVDFAAVADKVSVVSIGNSITSLPDDAFADFTDITIRCEAGSYASDYARRHGYKTDYVNSAETADGEVAVKGVTDGAVPSGTTLTKTDVDNGEISAEVVEKLGKAPEFAAIDLGMEKDGAAVSPRGKVRITVSVADGTKRYKVYRLNADGTLTDMHAAQGDGKLTFETDMLGRFILLASKFIPGDCNGDGKVTKADLLRLQKYLAKWLVDIDLDVADCNGDGRVTKADLLRLQKYLAKWPVKLGE